MSFDVFQVNVWAVLVSGVAYFAVGALWYGILGEPWMNALGKTRDELKSNPVDYLISLICEIAVIFFLAVALRAFEIQGVADAIFVGSLLWFGFSLLPTIVHYTYEDRTFTLLAINKFYDLVGILIGAIILSIWV